MAEAGSAVSNAIAQPRSLEDHLSHFPLYLLDSPCDDRLLMKLTELFSDWQGQLSANLQLTSVEVDDIEKAWPRDPARQRVNMFRRWRGKFSSQATYRLVAIKVASWQL